MKVVSRIVWAWLGGGLAAFFVVWALSSIFLDSVVPMTWDEELGMYVRAPGIEIRHRSEGWADTRTGKHGFTDDGAAVMAKEPSVFVLWGDSYVESLQVENRQKAMAIFNRDSTKIKGAAWGSGGLGVADYYFYIPRVESIYPNIEGHVILISGIQDVLWRSSFECHGRFLDNPWRLEEGECAPSQLSVDWAPFVHRLRLDFVQDLYRKLKDYRFRFTLGRINTPTGSASVVQSKDKYGEGWQFLLRSLTKQMNGFLVFVYCPVTPRLVHGSIETRDPDLILKERFKAVCKAEGVGFIDLTEAFDRLFKEKGKLPRGFRNTPQGEGHLNVVGQQIVAQALVKFFRGTPNDF